MSVTADSVLFSVTLEQEREVTITCDIFLDEGEYQLIYLNQDQESRLLHDGKIVQAEEQILFTEGENQIVLVSDGVVFKQIDVSVTGIEVSDFQ